MTSQELRIFENKGNKEYKIKLLEENGHNLSQFKKELIMSEDFLTKTYFDTKGKKTIGIGRLLNDDSDLRVVSIDVALIWLDEDCKTAEQDCKILFSNFQVLTENVRFALLEMTFNMGRKRLSGFKNMIKAIENKDFSLAALEALDSKWAFQDVGRNRSIKIAIKIFRGEK